jgi:hypothetical protein
MDVSNKVDGTEFLLVDSKSGFDPANLYQHGHFLSMVVYLLLNGTFFFIY